MSVGSYLTGIILCVMLTIAAVGVRLILEEDKEENRNIDLRLVLSRILKTAWTLAAIGLILYLVQYAHFQELLGDRMPVTPAVAVRLGIILFVTIWFITAIIMLTPHCRPTKKAYLAAAGLYLCGAVFWVIARMNAATYPRLVETAEKQDGAEYFVKSALTTKQNVIFEFSIMGAAFAVAATLTVCLAVKLIRKRWSSRNR